MFDFFGSLRLLTLNGFFRDAGTGGGGQEGQLPPLPFAGRGKGAKVPFKYVTVCNSKFSRCL